MNSGTTSNLKGVWGTSETDVFAVGDNGTILHHDGIAWSSITSGIINNLKDVWGNTGKDVFVVGDDSTILHYNGTDWSHMNSGTKDWLVGVWGSKGNDVFAVGSYSTILHYDSAGAALGAVLQGGAMALAYSRFDDSTREEVHTEYLASIEPYRKGTAYEVPAEFVVTSGRKP